MTDDQITVLRRCRSAAGWLTFSGVLLAGCGPVPAPPGDAVEPDANTADASLARADLILTLRDGGVRFSAPVTAGRRTLWVRNEGPNPHRALFARLVPGRSTDEARSWLAHPDAWREPRSPFLVLGGSAPLGLAADELVTLDFAPGTYLLLCPLREANGGRSAAHGMMQVLQVD